MTAVTSDADLAAPARAARGRIPYPLLLLAVAAIAGGIWLWRRYTFARHHVTSDNAQLDAHITPVSARVQGFVAKVSVEDNQQVRAGDTLVLLDDRDSKARLRQAEADLRAVHATLGGRRHTGQAIAQRNASEAAAAGAAANVAAAEATLRKATADLERYRDLAAKKVISAQQLDQAQWAVDNARSNVEAAQKGASAAGDQSVAADAQIRIAESRLAAALAAVEFARLQLGYTVITAPVSGVVAKRTVEGGTLVQPGQALLSVVQSDSVWVTANLKETQLAKVRAGGEVEFTVDAYPNVRFRGVVASLSPATGAKFALLPPDNATGNFTKVVQRVPVKIEVTSPPDPQHPLRPGMSAVVVIRVGS